MSQHYDLVVVGTGSGGAPAASKCRSEGWSVAVIDNLPYGGTCALRGCDPKKVLVGAGELVAWSRRMEGHGTVPALEADWPRLMAFKRTFTESVPENRERRFKDQGIDTYHGTARFVDEDAIQIEGETLGFDHLLLANGAKPAELPIEGFELLATSTDFLELDALPRRIVFVGGGYISFEFAHLAARVGADTTILHRGARPLKGFEPDLVERLVEHSRSAGIEIHLDTEVKAIEKHGNELVIDASRGGEPIRLDADLVVHGAGRVPAIDEMALEAGGVESTRDGVTVFDHLQSVSNQRVWAAGDAADTPGPPLTPVASVESLTVASNLRGNTRNKPNYTGIPTVVFTSPPLASVGMTEAEAREQGLRTQVNFQPDVTGWYSYRRLRSDAAAYKTIVDAETGKILGAHLLGESAGEMINLFALAIRHGLTADELRQSIYAYPTHASDLPHML